jgi:iron complex transport system substrate-binding protein
MRSHEALYELDEAAIAAARPDLILTQELCRVCAVGYEEVNEVARRLDGEVTVLSLEPTSVEGILNTIQTVGAMTEAEDAAIDVVEALRERLRHVNEIVAGRREHGFAPPRVAAIEWLDPPFAVGHWVPEQVRVAGGWELLGAEGGRSVPTTWDAVREVDPEILVLMPCGFDLQKTVAEWTGQPRPEGWDDMRAVQGRRVFAVDGSAYFSRPGPRVIDGIELLAELIDPGAFDGMSPSGSWARVG